MNFDDALKHYLPRAWFRYKFIKYKYLGRGEPEFHLVRHLVEPGTAAIDIGASFGMFAAEMAGRATRVLAFEANPEVAAFTRSVAPRNVEVVNVALSAQAGRATLSMPVNHKGNGVTELAGIDRTHEGESIAFEAETKRLDDFPVERCSFIKIDVEGHEEEVLDGAAALIARERPVLMIEAIDAFNPGVVARLSARYAATHGCFFLSHGALRPAATFDPARHQAANAAEYIASVLFIPPDRQRTLAAAIPFAGGP
jgi:FkbM family methyltransferase